MIHLAQPTFLGREAEYVNRTLNTRQLSAGPMVRGFEKTFAARCGRAFGVATTSGTTALHLVLQALGLQRGDKVIVPATTYLSTAAAVSYCGAEVVFVDVRPDTWTIDWTEVEHVVNHVPGIVGVIPVNLYGNPCIPATHPLPDHCGLWMVTDAAESHGATFGRTTAEIYSFYGNKILSTGEGGMVLCDDLALALSVRHLGSMATTEEAYQHDDLGFNYRMTELQGALGLAQVEALDQHLAIRRRLYARYVSHLGEHMRTAPGFVPWVFPVLWTEGRDEVAAKLFGADIETRPVFPPLHQQPIYQTGQRLGTAEALGRHGLLLPLHAGMTEGDVDYVCRTFEDAVYG